jgi:hypothetical protein
MRPRFSVITLAAILTFSPALVLQNVAPAGAAHPVTTADACGGITFIPGVAPNYNATGMNGVVTSLSGNPIDGFAFTFNNPYIDGALYNFTFQLYGFDGTPLYFAPSDAQGGLAIISGSYTLVSLQGSVWFGIPLEFQGQMGSVKLSITVSSLNGQLATNGWASAKAPPGTLADGGSPGC